MRKINIINVKQFINNILKEHNISTIETNYIISYCLNINMSDVYLLKDITSMQFFKIKRVCKKRVKGKPLTKIFNKAYFYGFEFYVNNNVLSCRQDTELLIEQILKCVNKQSSVLDLCCGSGCIGLTLNKLGYNNVTLSDVSKKALRVAIKNKKALNCNVNIIKSDMFNNITSKYDLIVSNPPYIPSNDIELLDKEVKKFDPLISLDGGEDGLKFYKIIAKESKKFLNSNGYLVLEIGFNQAESVVDLLKNDFECVVYMDYGNNDRVIVAKLK